MYGTFDITRKTVTNVIYLTYIYFI